MENWKKELKSKLEENPEITNDQLLEYFGAHNFGYYPTIIDLRIERRIIAQGPSIFDEN